ncbi:TraI/MobA(P) family conjugative relaxase [Ferrovibrio xuzhouensis]|uniref:TraI/MobA(P) family conjugative relaxase n=1 Tax=Ferrovibrio xuzhouensis TaxID=1576914 RepID=A0ABV7VDS1_9PROT
MIAKRIDIEPENDNYERLADYIAAAPEEGEKLDDLWIVNCDAGETLDDLPLAKKEIKATQALNQTAKSGKTYHLMVSFRDERPSPEALRDIEREFAQALGFGEHQRIAGTHINTENFHLHIAINKIHPVTLKVHMPFRDFKVLEKVSREMEKKYALKLDLGRADKIEPEKQAARARDKEAHTWEQSFDSYVREEAADLLAALDAARGWQDLHAAFGRFDLELRLRGNGLVIANASGTEMIKASALDRKFSKAALEHKLGTFIAPGDDLELEDGTTEGQSHELPVDQAAQPTSAVAGGQHGAGAGSAPDASGSTARLEPRATRPGFKARLQLHQAEISAAFQSAQDWQQLHTELARYGMVLRPRGNGLTIANANGKGMIKASALHRNFSMAAVQGRLGPFQTAQQVQAAGRQQPTRSGAAPAPLPRPARPPRPVKRYRPRPITRFPGQHRLWRQYMATKGKRRESLAVKAFHTWKEFLQAEALNDPLAMAIIVAQKKLLEALNPFSILQPRGNIPGGSFLPAAGPRPSISAARLSRSGLQPPQGAAVAQNPPGPGNQQLAAGNNAQGLQNGPQGVSSGEPLSTSQQSPSPTQRPNMAAQGLNPSPRQAAGWARQPSEDERQLLTAAAKAAEGKVLPVDRHWTDQALAARPGLSDHQQAVVRSVVDRRLGLVVDGDQIERLQTLATVRDAFAAAGLRVVGVATSDNASKTLQDATGITSGSLHVLGRLLAKGDLQLGQHDVLVVEANKIHAKQIIRLLEAAAPTGARVVLAGDGKGSTGPAWAMRLLAGHLQVDGGLAVDDRRRDASSTHSIAEIAEGPAIVI